VCRDKLGGDQLAGFQVSIVSGVKGQDELDVGDTIPHGGSGELGILFALPTVCFLRGGT
jgi:hypothetical protein